MNKQYVLKSFYFGLLCSLGLLLSNPVNALTIFNGNIDNDWFNELNWSNGDLHLAMMLKSVQDITLRSINH